MKCGGSQIRRLFLLVGLLLVACNRSNGPPATTAQDWITIREHQPQSDRTESDGKALLLSSAKAYSQLKSYKGAIQLESEAHYRGQVWTEKREGRIVWERPGRIFFLANDSNNNDSVLVSDGRRVWTSWPVNHNAPFVERESLREVLVEWSGISLHLSIMLPGFLMDVPWRAEHIFLPNGPLLEAFASDAASEGIEMIDGRHCHQIKCKRAIADWTIWIDVESHLVRRVRLEASPTQMQKQRTLGGGGASGKIGSSSIVQTFHIEEINAAIDAKVFQRSEAMERIKGGEIHCF